MVAVIPVVMVEIMLAMVAAVTVVTVEIMLAIPNLIILIPINLQVQKVGKIEVMETLLRILNMKVAEVGEKGASQMVIML
jgi:hypothetical protein